mgnify:CR=1 FL=1
MSFVKFILKVLIVFSLLLGGMLTCYYFADLKVREELKKECFGNNCPCFRNIVDYRLTREQAGTFLRYLKNREKRPDTKILEFTTFSDAQEIFEMLSVCQTIQAPSEKQNVVEAELPSEQTDLENEQEGQ